MVADPDSSDSSRLYPNERTDPSVTCQSQSIPTKFSLSAPKEVFTSKLLYTRRCFGCSPWTTEGKDVYTFWQASLAS